MPVMTGKSDGKARERAIKQIGRQFEQVRQFEVGCEKPDMRGGLDNQKTTIPGVVATSVREILPLQQAEILKLSLVLNEDELNDDCINAASITNGHLLYQI